MKRKSKTFVGKVIKNKVEKSIVVKIERFIKHPIYKKFVRKTTRLHAHDQDKLSKIGDTVEVCMCRPISKTKSWRLIRIVKD